MDALTIYESEQGSIQYVHELKRTHTNGGKGDIL